MTKEEKVTILKRLLKPKYVDFFSIKDSVLEYIVELSDIYLKEQSFPDKAIDILDSTLVMKQGEINKEDVLKTFSLYYKIENINEDKVSNVLNKEIYGQEEVIRRIKSLK